MTGHKRRSVRLLARLAVVIVVGFMVVVGFIGGSAFLQDHRDSAGQFWSPVLQLLSIPAAQWPAIADALFRIALIALLLIVAVALIRIAWRPRGDSGSIVIRGQGYMGLPPFVPALPPNDHRQTPLPLQNPADYLPKFIRDWFADVDAQTRVIYRYSPTNPGDFYHGVPPRDLTNADYAALPPESRKDVDSGKLYKRIGQG